MTPLLAAKSAVALLAVAGAFAMARAGVFSGAEALDFAKWLLGYWFAGATVAAVMRPQAQDTPAAPRVPEKGPAQDTAAPAPTVAK